MTSAALAVVVVPEVDVETGAVDPPSLEYRIAGAHVAAAQAFEDSTAYARDRIAAVLTPVSNSMNSVSTQLNGRMDALSPLASNAWNAASAASLNYTNLLGATAAASSAMSNHVASSVADRVTTQQLADAIGNAVVDEVDPVATPIATDALALALAAYTMATNAAALAIAAASNAVAGVSLMGLAAQDDRAATLRVLLSQGGVDSNVVVVSGAGYEAANGTYVLFNETESARDYANGFMSVTIGKESFFADNIMDGSTQDLLYRRTGTTNAWESRNEKYDLPPTVVYGTNSAVYAGVATTNYVDAAVGAISWPTIDTATNLNWSTSISNGHFIATGTPIP